MGSSEFVARMRKLLRGDRGSGARETALFFGRHYGRLNLKELGQLAGGIHHNAVNIAIRRFTERLKSDSTLLAKFSLVHSAA